jgi:hypothetical protein
MKYLMLVIAGTDDSTEADHRAAPSIEEWGDYVTGRNAWVIGDRLRPTEDATTVRVRGGELLVSDGPFTESKEWIAGFDVLECEDLDEAIEIARKHPQAHGGSIELRPFWPLDGD